MSSLRVGAVVCGHPRISEVLTGHLKLLLLLSCWLTTAAGYLQVEEKLKDVIVQNGDKARFLCTVTSVPPHFLSDQPVTVYWNFQGRRLDIDPKLEGEGHYMTKSFDNRHVLVVNRARAEDEGLYTCVVKAGNQTDSATGRLTVLSPPEPPIEVRVKSCHGNTAEIAWLPGEDNGADITSYTVQFNLSEKPDAWFDFYEEIPGDSTQAYVELSPYGTYSFRVIAKNIVGESRPSSVTARECTTPPDRPDRNPRNVRTRTDKKGFLVIEWEPLHRLSFHGPGFCYFVLWRSKGSLAWNSATVNGTYASRFEQEVDDVYGLYEFQVKSKNDMGDAHQPAFIYLGRSFEAEPAIPVVGFRLDDERPLTESTAHFVWESIDPNDRKMNGKFRGYKILYWRWNEEETNKKEVYIAISASSVRLGQRVRGSISDLPAYSTFRVQVVVVNTHYQGPPSEVIDVFTPEGTPSAVQGLFADSVTADSVTLRWLPPERPNGILTGFDIGYQAVLGNRLGSLVAVPSVADSPQTLQARIGQLRANQRYRFYIVARTRAGRGVRAEIDVRTTNHTASAVTSGNKVYRAHSETPSLAPDNSATLLQSDIPLLFLMTLTVTWYFSHPVFHPDVVS